MIREGPQAAMDRMRQLRRFGWTEDRNVRFDYRWGDGSAKRWKALAAELVQSAPDAIVVAGNS